MRAAAADRGAVAPAVPAPAAAPSRSRPPAAPPDRASKHGPHRTSGRADPSPVHRRPRRHHHGHSAHAQTAAPHHAQDDNPGMDGRRSVDVSSGGRSAVTAWDRGMGVSAKRAPRSLVACGMCERLSGRVARRSSSANPPPLAAAGREALSLLTGGSGRAWLPPPRRAMWPGGRGAGCARPPGTRRTAVAAVRAAILEIPRCRGRLRNFNDVFQAVAQLRRLVRTERLRFRVDQTGVGANDRN